MRILVIEDDSVIAERLKHALERCDFLVDVAHDGEAGLAMALGRPYSLVLLDLMLPGRNGFEVCETLRSRKVAVPILMLTARDAVDDKVKGLNTGADDYLAKPFDFQELVARINALLRRDKVHKSAVIRIADVEIDSDARVVRRAGTEVRLTPHEYRLLEALARNEGRTLTREIILESVWGDHDVYSNTVDFHITSLRKKIDAGHELKLIHTVHGVGYVMRSCD